MSRAVRVDELGRVVVQTRAWSRSVSQGQPGVPSTPSVREPFLLAEAFGPQPLGWLVSLVSSNPATNLVPLVEVLSLEGGPPLPAGIISWPYVGQRPFAAQGVRVSLIGGTFATGERVSCTLAPSSWPAWMVPDSMPRLAALVRQG